MKRKFDIISIAFLFVAGYLLSFVGVNIVVQAEVIFKPIFGSAYIVLVVVLCL